MNDFVSAVRMITIRLKAEAFFSLYPRLVCADRSDVDDSRRSRPAEAWQREQGRICACQRDGKGPFEAPSSPPRIDRQRDAPKQRLKWPAAGQMYTYTAGGLADAGAELE